MLRPDVVDAAKAGRFHVYAVSTIDEAVELLTGVSAGELNEAGEYPEGSINSRVQLRLTELAKLKSESGESDKESEET
jgi:predicted ATP-dependent protease